MPKEIILNIPLPQAKQAFQKEIKRSKYLDGHFISNNGFRLKSKDHYDRNMNMIEHEKFTLLGRLEAKGEQTKIRYSVSGNRTFSIMIIPILLALFPTLIFSFSNLDETSILGLSISFVSIVLFSLLLLYWKNRKLQQRGEQIFEIFLSGL